MRFFYIQSIFKAINTELYFIYTDIRIRDNCYIEILCSLSIYIMILDISVFAHVFRMIN